MSIKTRHSTSAQAGYSLLEMCISLIILGVVMTGLLQAYNIYMQREKFSKTQVAIEQAIAKIQTFRQENGFYPCPASLDAVRTDPAYGVPTDCSVTTQAVQTCAGGICIEESVRTDLGYTPRVRVGTLPFRVLQMDEKETFDAYNSRLVYSLTERQGVLATFQDLEGGINVVNENNEDMVSPRGSLHFIIVSPGPNKVGAYDQLGALVSPCNAGTLEGQNCRDMGAPPLDATYSMSSLALAGAATDFDDFVQYFSAQETPLWRRENPTSENIVDMSDGNVGIGTNNPAAILTLTQSTVATTGANAGKLVTTNSLAAGDESGALRISGSLRADNYCEPGSVSCFKPKNIAGDNDTADPDSGMTCPAGTYMTGVQGNGTDAKPVCAPVRVMCPAGTPALTGLTAAGAPICSAVMSTCGALTDTLCTGGDVSIAAGTPHGSIQPFVRGDCRGRTYTCNNGTWNYSAVTGACVNTSTVTTTNPSCGPGYGTQTYTVTTSTCGGTTNNWADVCPMACEGYSTTGTQSCPAPYSGTQTRSIDYTCDVNGYLVPTYGAWTPPCGCGLSDVYEFANCPSGYIRQVPPSPTSFPASGTAPATSWPVSTTAGQYRLNTVVLPACVYANPGWNSSNCTCDMTSRYYAELQTWPACEKAQTGGRVNPDGVSVSGYGLGSVPWSHRIVKYDINGGTCTQNGTGTVVSAAQSQPRVYKWKDTGPIAAAPTATNPGYPVLNEGCTCAQNMTTTQCVQESGALWYYFNCQCQEQ